EIDETPARTDAKEEEVKIRQLDEELDSVRTDLAFSKEREATLTTKLDQADKAAASLKNELITVRSELQRQVTQSERVEQALAQTSQDLDQKKELASELARGVHDLKRDLETSKSKSGR
ncbi:hypothetical protein AVEN_67684-1, partial [Araneus ventricosus]